jgi:single-strand DNA-binding protein
MVVDVPAFQNCGTKPKPSRIVMSKSVNKVSLLGRLGRDPDLRFTGTGTPFCRLRVATNDSFKNQEGEWTERTEWHTLVAWSKLAEICNQYLKKGDQAYFEGSLQTRSFEDSNGNTRYVTEVKLREMILLGSPGGDQASAVLASATNGQAESEDESIEAEAA